MEMSSALTVNIKKDFPGFKIEAEWSADGDITCLFGYTGSGKSLTLKMIAGLIRPDEGEISFGDNMFFKARKGVNVSPQDRDIGYVFQDNMLFPHMTVYQNVVYGLKDVAKESKWICDVIRTLRLETLENKYPHQISGGQQQRTAIARAVIRRPKLLLLDEPFNSLDHAVRRKMHRETRRYQKYFNIPIILVTHDMDELHSLADWVVLYNDGRVEQTGRPQDVFARPATRAAARLIAAKNIFDVEVKSVAGGVAELSNDRVRFFAKADNQKVGDKVVCCIRPEHIFVVEPNASAENRIAAVVVDIVRNASSYDLFLKIGDGSYTLELRVSAEQFKRHGVSLGKDIFVSVEPCDVHLIKTRGLGL